MRATLAALTTKPTRQLLDYLAAYDPHVASLFLALREIVLEEAPSAIESYPWATRSPSDSRLRANH